MPNEAKQTIRQLREENKHLRMQLAAYEQDTPDKACRQALDALRKSEHKFRSLVEQASEELFLHDTEGRIVDVNSAAEHHTGYTRDALCTMSVFDIDPDAHEREDMKKIWKGLAVEDPPMRFRVRHTCKDGSIYPAEVSASKVVLDDGTYILALARDVTQSSEAEKALRESESRFRILFEAAPDAYYLNDLTGKLLDGNAKAEELTGYSKDELIGKSLLERNLLPLRQVPRAAMALKKNIAGKSTGPQEFIIRRKDGTRVDVEISTIPVTINNKRVVLGLARDITRRKEAERARHHSEEKYRAYVENAPEGILVTNKEGRYTDVNKAACRITGYSREELLQMRIPQLTPAHARHRAFTAFGTLRDTGEIQIETVIQKKDGTRIDVALKAVALNHEHYMAFCSDITERKKAEERLRESEAHFRSLFENMNSGVVVYEAVDAGDDFIIVDFNAAVERFTGVSRKEAAGKRVTEVFPGVAPAGILAVFQSVYATGEAQHLPLTRYQDARIELWVENRVFRLPSGRIVAIYDDRTEQRLLEQRVHQAEKMEAIGQLAGGIAHDFNNILGGIIGYADMSREEAEKGSRLRKNAKKILQAGERAKHLVNQILSFSRQSPETKTPVYIKPIVKEVVQLLRASLPSSIEIKSKLARDTKPVCADPTKIHEVVMNLATNAAHAMGDKGGLEITCGEQDVVEEFRGRIGPVEPGLYSVITIADTGCGMTEEVCSRMFEPFFTTKEVGKGTGMGLSAVFGIVQSHGGNIIVDTAPGNGTTFVIYLPKTGEPMDTGTEDEAGIQGGSEHIMFVDDEEALGEMVRDMLGDLGYTVVAFRDSTKAWQHFQQAREDIDLVITDQTMPDMSGMELAKKILACKPGVPVILCTGYSQSVGEHDALELGIGAFCMKPLRKRDLARRIRTLLDTRKEEHHAEEKSPDRG
jgi:PAS domain S-box-containing protein